jgi:glutamate dehydrogenase (NAD(P)+)
LWSLQNKKWEEYGKEALLSVLEKQFARPLASSERMAVVTGASEQALIQSGLEDTMVQAVAETRKTAARIHTDLRTAAYVNAIHKISSVHIDSGSFFS